MANFENRDRDSAKGDPNMGQENDKFAPGRQGEGGSEPREGQEPQGQRPTQEYPGEGQHYPSSGQQTGGSQSENAPSGEDSVSDNNNDGAE